MRESFGGAFMIKLVLVFIVIYISFMAVAVNYAKAFRVKNNVINILEQSQYKGESSVRDKIDDYLSGVPYNLSGNTSAIQNCQSEGGSFTTNGACIVTKGDAKNVYYKVITYIPIEFPFFNIFMTFPVSGETKVIS